MKTVIHLTNKTLGIETDDRFPISAEFISRKAILSLKNMDGSLNLLLCERTMKCFDPVRWGSSFAIKRGEYLIVRYWVGSIRNRFERIDLFGVGMNGKILKADKNRLLCPNDRDIAICAQRDERFRLFAHILVLRKKREILSEFQKIRKSKSKGIKIKTFPVKWKKVRIAV